MELVRKIENGTVIDHIPAGIGFKIAEWLSLNKSNDVFVLLSNVESEKLGKKDIIKINGKFLSEDEYKKISLLAPSATINIVHDSKVVQKHKVSLPKTISAILKCPNPNCITNTEECQTEFSIKDKKLRCRYCERCFSVDDLNL